MLNLSIDKWMKVIKVENPPAQRLMEQWYNSSAYRNNIEIRDRVRNLLVEWSDGQPRQEEYEREVFDRFFIHMDKHNIEYGSNRASQGTLDDVETIKAAYTSITFMAGLDAIYEGVEFEVTTIYTAEQDMEGDLRDKYDSPVYDDVVHQNVERGYPGYAMKGLQYLSLQIRCSQVNTNFKRPVYFTSGWHDLITLGELSTQSDFGDAICQQSYLALSEHGAKNEAQSSSDGTGFCLNPNPNDRRITNADFIAILHMTFGAANPNNMDTSQVMNFPINIIGNAPENLVERYLEHVDQQQVTDIMGQGEVVTHSFNDYFRDLCDEHFTYEESPYFDIIERGNTPNRRIPPPSQSNMWTYLKVFMKLRDGPQKLFDEQWDKFGINMKGNAELLASFDFIKEISEKWGMYHEPPIDENEHVSTIAPNPILRMFHFPQEAGSKENWEALKQIHMEYSDGRVYDDKEWESDITQEELESRLSRDDDEPPAGARA